MRIVYMKNISESHRFATHLESIWGSDVPASAWRYFLLDEDKSTIADKTDGIDLPHWVSTYNIFTIDKASDILSGKIKLKTKLPMFWKDHDSVWVSIDGYKTMQVFKKNLFHCDYNTWWSISELDNSSDIKRSTQAECEEFLNAKFDGEKFVRNKVKIVIDGKECWISQESAKALRESLEITA